MNLSEIQELGVLIQRLREADPRLRLFGAQSHRYQLGATLTEAELREFEQVHSITLPEDYRLFLREVGNGGAGPSYGLFPLQDARRGDLSTPFPLTKAPEVYSDEELAQWYDMDGYPGMLGICGHGCDGYSYLVVNGPSYGTVWEVWEESSHPFIPREVTFAVWYRRWAEKALRIFANESLVDKLAVGMTKEQVIAVTGGDWKEGKYEYSKEYYLAASEIPVQLMLSGENGVVKAIRRQL